MFYRLSCRVWGMKKQFVLDELFSPSHESAGNHVAPPCDGGSTVIPYVHIRSYHTEFCENTANLSGF